MDAALTGLLGLMALITLASIVDRLAIGYRIHRGNREDEITHGNQAD